jgi:branched-chain amino acid aminotransferase
MILMLNGEPVPLDQVTLSPFDRGFLYGDGLFETILVRNGRPFRLSSHLDRLRTGCRFLKIPWNTPLPAMEARTETLLRRNAVRDAVLKIQVTRGTGARGYSIVGANSPTEIMSLHPAPEPHPALRWNLRTSSYRVMAGDPLAQIKSCSKILHVLAKTEAQEAGADEALLLNQHLEVAEATCANVFWIEQNTVFTPPPESGALPGITRQIALDLCTSLGCKCFEERASLDRISQSDGLFLTLTTLGIVEVGTLDNRQTGRSDLIATLRKAHSAIQENELGPV